MKFPVPPFYIQEQQLNQDVHINQQSKAEMTQGETYSDHSIGYGV
jgi:hypothetical protein